MCWVDVAIPWPSMSHALGMISRKLLLFFLVSGFFEGLICLFVCLLLSPAKLASSVSQKFGLRVASIAQEYIYIYYFYWKKQPQEILPPIPCASAPSPLDASQR